MNGNNIMQGHGAFLGARVAQPQVSNSQTFASAPRILSSALGGGDIRFPSQSISPFQPGIPFSQPVCCNPVSDQQSTIQMLIGLVYNLTAMMSQMMNGLLSRFLGSEGAASLPMTQMGVGGAQSAPANSPKSSSFFDKIGDLFSSARDIYGTVKDIFFGGSDKTKTNDSGEETSGGWGSTIMDVLGIGAGLLLGRGARKVAGAAKKGASWLWNTGKDVVSKGISWIGGLFS